MRTFNRADVGAVQACPISQLLLRDAGRGSQALQVERQNRLRVCNREALAFKVVEIRLRLM